MTTIRRTLDIDPVTDARLHELAIERGQDISIVLAEAVALLDSVIDLPDIAEDRRRLNEFYRTGEGIPWDDVKAWMQRWGTPGELPTPKPRKL